MFKAALAFIVSLCSVAVAEDHVLYVTGSTTVYSNLIEPYLVVLEEETGIRFEVSPNSSSKGLKALSSGQADVAMVSASPETILQRSNLIEQGDRFVFEQVGETVVGFAVHTTNPIDTLSKQQVTQILQGNITHWAEVGGPEAEIMIITENVGGGFRTTIEKSLLNGEVISGNVSALPSGLQVAKVAEQVPSAFIVISTNLLKNHSLKRLTTDADVSQPLILATKTPAMPEFNSLVTAAKYALRQD